MMNKKTLITFVGRGKQETGTQGYKMTSYDFGDGVIRKSSCFAEAVRISGKFQFDEVLFVGTPTSTWSSLLESTPDAEDFCMTLWELETANAPLDAETAAGLETILGNIWQKPVRLCINPQELRTDNCEEIFDRYIREIFDSGDDILLDITHSFRWMPLLLTSALQFKNAYHPSEENGGSIEIIYGEFNNTQIAPVRHLDVLARGQKNADAVALFFQKFEAEPLAKKLEPYWPDGANAVKKFGLHIQGNYFLPLLFDMPEENFPIGRPLAQLRNALNDFEKENKPEWVIQVHKHLQNIYKALSTPLSPDRLVNLAKMLAERKLYGQAIIAICLAAEQSLIVAYEHKKHPGYKGINACQDRLRKDIKNNRYTVFYFNDIKHLRAQVAHGGLAQQQNSILQPEALKMQYEKILNKQLEWQTYLNSQFLHDKRRK